jgi:short chain dehydrogenase
MIGSQSTLYVHRRDIEISKEIADDHTSNEKVTTSNSEEKKCMKAFQSMSKTILITGASSGFGRDTAETLFRAGHIVYASMRGTQGKNERPPRPWGNLGIMTVELDVSDDASVEAGVKKGPGIFRG